jgi:hypothetical protein
MTMASKARIETIGRVCRPLSYVNLRGVAPDGSRLEVSDGYGRVYASREVSGAFEVGIMVGGALGRHCARLLSAAGEELGERAFHVDAATEIRSESGDYGTMWMRLESLVRRTRSMYVLHGKPMTFYVPWVRDDVHVMKAFKYWEPEAGSLPAHFLSLQQPDGMIFDYIRPAGFAAERMEAFGPRFYQVDDEEGFRYDRLPVEADVEYLLIEGVYTAWQARGDDEWMAKKLPGMEKAIEYCMTDPMRWSPEHGLVKRGYTIDTWDFKFFGFDREHLTSGLEVQDAVFNVHDDTPMCIMHGDNSGLYQACRQVATMHAALGHEDKAAEFDAKADSIRENTDRHCWNGRYYDHWVPVTPLEMDQGGVDGSKVMSLSNPYDMNRGLPDHQKCVNIIREYMDLREKLKDTHFAEWLATYPCWPKGFSGVEANEYVNGGIILIVAGELAKAAFHHGFEAYGADILARVNALLNQYWHADKGKTDRGRRFQLPCTYTPSGEPSHGIPDNWAQAAVMSAMMEGLCGLRDGATCYREAMVQPRWVAAGIRDAAATARYGASDGYVAYAFRHDAATRRIEIDATGSGERLDFHVLLPEGTRATGAEFDGAAVEFENAEVETSSYVDLRLPGVCCGTLAIAYEPSA